MNPELMALVMNLALPWTYTPAEATIVFAGDAMQHEAQLQAARTGSGSYDYSCCFTELEPYIAGADYAVVNLETPLGDSHFTGYPCFNAPASFASALKDAGFDLFLTANNHTLDRRDRGLRRTEAILDSLGVDHIGTYSSPARRADSTPLVKDINGFRVAFLNYTYGTNGITPGAESVVDYIDRDLIDADITEARSRGAELICVAVHWGDEYRLLPNDAQRSLARFLQSRGVDLIIGSHPHVIQPMEMHSSPHDPLDRQLTVYSLGNFISNMKTRDTRGGAMVKVMLIRDLHDRARIYRANYLPVFTVPAADGFNFHLIEATAEAPARADAYRRDFLRSATAIFDRHNIDVAPDTLPRR